MIPEETRVVLYYHSSTYTTGTNADLNKKHIWNKQIECALRTYRLLLIQRITETTKETTESERINDSLLENILMLLMKINNHHECDV